MYMHEKPLPEAEFYLPMGGPPFDELAFDDDADDSDDTDALPVHLDVPVQPWPGDDIPF